MLDHTPYWFQHRWKWPCGRDAAARRGHGGGRRRLHADASDSYSVCIVKWNISNAVLSVTEFTSLQQRRITVQQASSNTTKDHWTSQE
eukprot:101009-Chlamydomonas_euryale.AAC.5